MFDLMDTFEIPQSSSSRNELDRYLNEDIEDVDDALQWWYNKRSTYPNLWRMATDYLSIPGKPLYMCLYPYVLIPIYSNIC